MAKDHPTDPAALPEGARLIPGFPDYCVTPEGAVYSRFARADYSQRPRHWKRLAASPERGRGYVHVNLYRHGAKLRHFRIHVLVMLAFVGPCPEGLEIRHLDGNKSNNRLGNLAYGTPTENGEDTRKLGLARRGEAHYHAKIAAETVREIRRLYSEGRAVGDIAGLFRLRRGHVSRICSRVLWGHVE
jgi:hypothetical protein